MKDLDAYEFWFRSYHSCELSLLVCWICNLHLIVICIEVGHSEALQRDTEGGNDDSEHTPLKELLLCHMIVPACRKSICSSQDRQIILVHLPNSLQQTSFN